MSSRQRTRVSVVREPLADRGGSPARAAITLYRLDVLEYRTEHVLLIPKSRLAEVPLQRIVAGQEDVVQMEEYPWTQ